MLKKFTMTTMAAAIALTGMTAAPVQANNNQDFAKFLLGAAAIIAISQASKNNKAEPRHERHAHTKTPHVSPHRPDPRKRPTYARIDPLPAQCLTQFHTSKGVERYFGSYCLQKTYDDYRKLPQKCETTIWSSRGKREVFSPRCLKDNGFEL